MHPGGRTGANAGGDIGDIGGGGAGGGGIGEADINESPAGEITVGSCAGTCGTFFARLLEKKLPNPPSFLDLGRALELEKALRVVVLGCAPLKGLAAGRALNANRDG